MPIFSSAYMPKAKNTGSDKFLLKNNLFYNYYKIIGHTREVLESSLRTLPKKVEEEQLKSTYDNYDHKE